MSKILTLIAAIFAVGLFAAGCGDDDDDGTTDATATLTKAQFVKQGNAICEAGNQEINSEFEKFAKENGLSENKPPTEAQLEEAAEGFLLPSISRQLEAIRALGAPEGEEDAVNEFLDNAEAEVEEIEDDPSLLESEGDEPEAFEDVNREARAIGLTACGE